MYLLIEYFSDGSHRVAAKDSKRNCYDLLNAVLEFQINASAISQTAFFESQYFSVMHQDAYDFKMQTFDTVKKMLDAPGKTREDIIHFLETCNYKVKTIQGFFPASGPPHDMHLIRESIDKFIGFTVPVNLLTTEEIRGLVYRNFIPVSECVNTYLDNYIEELKEIELPF
jgi:hypothetical protein